MLRGFCVYQFKNQSLEVISRTAQIPIEDVFVEGLWAWGIYDFCSQSITYGVTDCLKITWWVYELDVYLPLPGTGSGVTLNEKNTVNIMDIHGSSGISKVVT